MGRPILKDLVGKRVGRWVVLGHSHMDGKLSYFLCRCDCGTERPVLRGSLVKRVSTSCGCFTKEVNAARPNPNLRHGMRHSAEYRTWSGMKRRCENPNEKCYPRYGGRGIVVRYENFEEFFSDVGPKPSPAHTIDRIDTNGHYEPGNVRWATYSQQARNKRGSLKVAFKGRDASLADLCDELGVNYKLAWGRIKRGWTAERALGCPECS